MKETMQNRLTTLREKLGINKSEFARKLNLTPQAISSIELGKATLTGRNIDHICLTFHVSEQWLRTGEGEMFTSEDPDTDEFLAIYRALSPPFRKMFLEYGRFLIEQQALIP